MPRLLRLMIMQLVTGMDAASLKAVDVLYTQLYSISSKYEDLRENMGITKLHL